MFLKRVFRPYGACSNAHFCDGYRDLEAFEFQRVGAHKLWDPGDFRRRFLS